MGSAVRFVGSNIQTIPTGNPETSPGKPSSEDHMMLLPTTEICFTNPPIPKPEPEIVEADVGALSPDFNLMRRI